MILGGKLAELILLVNQYDNEQTAGGMEGHSDVPFEHMVRRLYSQMYGTQPTTPVFPGIPGFPYM